MKYSPDKHHRRSLRLAGYDYSSAGAYFITLCTHQRECLFGAIADGQMHLNELGQIVALEWTKTQHMRPEFELDEWVIMPNHLHGIITITASSQQLPEMSGALSHLSLPNAALKAEPWKRRPRSLSSCIAGFKSTTTRQINVLRNAAGTPIWQRNYYDHIIRNEAALERIRVYIATNPSIWLNDQLHPDNPSKW